MCLPFFSQYSNGSSGGLSTASRFRQLKLTSLLLVLACLTLTGCNANPLHDLFSRSPDLHIPAGKCAEIRKPVTIYTWSHDKDGNAVKSHYHAYAGGNVGPGVPASEIK